MGKGTYRSKNVEAVGAGGLLAQLGTAVVVLGVDVAKHDFAAAIATGDGAVVQQLRFRHPEQSE
ncbi:MAG: hypothetical protein HY744_22645, partial [Deltaproteobacteria bacterium]|nr:hypothetical protein [Deltaproteobacteria bacterium]